jgi:hypothetical protein
VSAFDNDQFSDPKSATFLAPKEFNSGDDSIEIWPAAVARVSGSSASPRRNSFTCDNGIPPNMAELVLCEQPALLLIYGKYWGMGVKNILFCWSWAVYCGGYYQKETRRRQISHPDAMTCMGRSRQEERCQTYEKVANGHIIIGK